MLTPVITIARRKDPNRGTKAGAWTHPPEFAEDGPRGFHCIVSIVSIVSILCIISILSILSFFTFLQSLRFAFALVSSSQFQSIRLPWRLDDKEPYFSSFFLELQLTIFTLSALTNWPPLSSLKVTLRIRKVQTSSQKR